MLRATLLSIALALVLAPAAEAMIQVDRGIAGARLGATQDQVRAALGTPSGVSTGTSEFGPFTVFRYAGGIRVTFQGNVSVTQVTTTGLGDRTARGVGVRSSERTVRRRVRGVKCATHFGFRSCDTGSGLAGQHVTSFFIRKGKVTRVSVGIVID